MHSKFKHLSKHEGIIQFHENLNPKLWENDKLKPIVRLQLLKNAYYFYQFIGIDSLLISDVVMVGSNAAYNYSKNSDIDVHLVADYEKLGNSDLMMDMFKSLKDVWSDNHNISIYGFPVEMFVENNISAISSGRYSLIRDEWIMHPSDLKPNLNNHTITKQVEHYAELIDGLCNALQNNNNGSNAQLIEQLKKLRHDISSMRKTSLAKGGEFSSGNLAFKTLHGLGYLDKMNDVMTKYQDKELSLEGVSKK